MAPELRDYKLTRLQEARAQLLAAAAKLLREQGAADSTAEQASGILKALKLQLGVPPLADSVPPADSAPPAAAPSATLLGHTYTLQRKGALCILEKLGASCVLEQVQTDTPDTAVKNSCAVYTVTPGSVTPSVLRVLVVGGWCTQTAQVLRRSVLVQQLCSKFGDCCDDLMAALRAQVRSARLPL